MLEDASASSDHRSDKERWVEKPEARCNHQPVRQVPEISFSIIFFICYDHVQASCRKVVERSTGCKQILQQSKVHVKIIGTVCKVLR